ncbi:hypothetical protein FG386_000790 [Cryptosporidium ryanae]|uniref:uncharacterized protein n=1 Tax=Cryptosporidium ryanae TaxID=515981 RepID=UPI00351A43EF|nr:hypothetical protein FG386_000790 [Cryptosporidium ryanae]
MQSSQSCSILCCISNWHKESGNKFYDGGIRSSNISHSLVLNKRAPIYGVGCMEQSYENDYSVNSGPNGKRKFKDFLESNIQPGCVPNILTISRLLSEWRKNNEIKNSFVMELIDFTRLCGVKRNVTYKDLFELLSKSFESKLKTKKINDSLSYKKFDFLASKCVKLVNIPHLLSSIIMVLTKFNRLPERILNELTTPDLHLFPSFLSFYKMAPIKLRQQMWLKRPDWFVYEILPFIMLFTKLSSNVDCYSFNNSKYNDFYKEVRPLREVNSLLEKLKTDIDRDSNTEIRKYIEDYMLEFSNGSSSFCTNCIGNHVQHSNSIDSIFSFISRIKALYTSCVELEHNEIELFGESCKCLAFSCMDSFEFYKCFFQLQRNEYIHSSNCINLTIGNINNCLDSSFKSIKGCNNFNNSGRNSFKGGLSHTKSASLSNYTITNLTICGNILKLGRIVAYISYCIGNYKELYFYFVSTLKQIYLDSLSHNVGGKIIHGDDFKSTQGNLIQHETVSLYDNSHFFRRYLIETHNNSSNEKVDLRKIKINDPELNKHEIETDRQKYKNLENLQNTYFEKKDIKPFNYQFEQKLNNFSGEPLLATLRVFVALRIFHFENKTNWNEDEDVKVADFDNNASGNKTIDLNSEKIIGNSSSKCESYIPLTISECDPIAWPCINIIGNMFRDGFSSNKSQELLVNVSSTLVIKSPVELAEIAFVFSEPHFLFICSEFVLETSILTMFHSSMDAQLVLNPQRRKIPIGLISLGLNSVFLTHKNRNAIIESSSFLNVTNSNSLVNGMTLENNIASMTHISQLSNFGNSQYTESNVLSNINIQSNLKKKQKKMISDDSTSVNTNQYSDSNYNFAIRLDALLNLLTSFNIDGGFIENKKFEINSEPISYLTNIHIFDINSNLNSASMNPINSVYAKILKNLNKLNYTIFTTFLPLVDRYLELSISTEKTNMSNLGKETEVINKVRKNEVLKLYRNELMEYINSLSSKEYCHSNDISLKFVRLISSSLFFTGVKPTFARHENSQTYHSMQNIIGLYYGYFHDNNDKIDQNVSFLCNQASVPLLPSCINLSIRLLEVSFCSDWLNQLFLKSVLGLLHTYPKISGKNEKNNAENGDVDFTICNHIKPAGVSLLASIPEDIIQGLLFRIVLPSVRDPLISSSEINVVNEIIANKDILNLLDNKTRKICIERLWFRCPFQFAVNYESVNEQNSSNKSSQKLQIKDIYQYLVDSSSENKEIKEISLFIPYKVMVWEHHFIGNNDSYFIFIRWLVYFQKLCTILDKESQISNKLLMINDLIDFSNNKLKPVKN